LVVDDSATNRLVLKGILTAWGMQVVEAPNGVDGLAELMRAHESGDPYRLVLLDCRMPEMDGFQVAERLRAIPNLAGITVMMLTSDSRTDDKTRSHELGMAGYLVKPVKRAELFEAIATAMGRSQVFAPAPALDSAPAVTKDQRALRILLAEDSQDNRLLVQSYLKHTPHHLDLADNGAIAVAKFKARGFDLVLMDMQMPIVDGYAATRAIKQWGKDIAAMLDAVQRGDFETVRVLGHSMKGAGGGYGFDAITEIGAALEQAAKQRNAAEIRNRVQELSRYLDRVEVISD